MTWLVRTLSQKMLGPISKEQVSQWILSGRISLQDEVCEANGYWFFVHEKEEVKRWLGIELPRATETRARDAFGTDEVTETEPGTPRHRNPNTPAPGTHSPLSPLTLDGQYTGESTQMLVRPPSGHTPPLGTQVSTATTVSATRTATPVPRAYGAPEPENVQSRFFSQVGWLFIAGLVGLIAVIFRLARLD